MNAELPCKFGHLPRRRPFMSRVTVTPQLAASDGGRRSRHYHERVCDDNSPKRVSARTNAGLEGSRLDRRQSGMYGPSQQGMEEVISSSRRMDERTRIY
jgi:hypothetical protein